MDYPKLSYRGCTIRFIEGAPGHWQTNDSGLLMGTKTLNDATHWVDMGWSDE